MLWMCCNYMEEKCAHNYGEINKVFTLGFSLMFQIFKYPKLGLLNGDGHWWAHN